MGDIAQQPPGESPSSSVGGSIDPRMMPSMTQRTIKKRVRNRYGLDTRHMGFEKRYVINKQTGRANQLFQCLYCPNKSTKLCNMVDHQKTHRRKP